MSVTKGITIEFRGDAAPLKNAINSIRKEAKTLDTELKYVNNSLKFNPASVTLWSQKQKVLTQNIAATKARLDELIGIRNKLEAQGISRTSAEFREVEREIYKAKNSLSALRKELASVGSARLTALSEGLKTVGAKLSQIGMTLSTQVTLPLSLLGGKAVKSFAEVDKTMTLTNKTMGNTAKEAKLLNKAMKEAAAQSTFGMSDAANATLNFARAGLSAEQAASALAPAMNLASAQGGQLDTVSAGLVATINGFSGSFEEASTYADVFANACSSSALDIDSLSTSMSVAAPIFSSAGYSVKDAALYMGIMANKGIAADKAANSLKTGMARLVTPTKDAQAWMDKLSLSFTNSDGTMKDTLTIQKELHKAFSGLSESEQLAAASALFGKNQMAPWLALIKTSPKEVSALSTALGTEGTANEQAAAQMSGFGGSLEALKSSIDVAVTSLGEALAPTIQKISGAISKAVAWFNSLDEGTKGTIATVGLVVAAIGPALLIAGKVISVLGLIAGGISKVIGVIKLLSTTALGPIGLAIAAVIAIGVLLYKNWDKIKEKAKQLKDWVVKKWSELKEKVVGFATAVRDKVVGAWNSLKTKVSNLVTGVKNKIVGIWTSIKNTITKIVLTIVIKQLTMWKNLKEKVSSIVTAIKTWISDKFTAMKEKVSAVWTSIKTTAVNVWNGIKNAIMTPIKAVWNGVKKVIDKIKGIFSSLKLKLPKIKMPHFSVSPPGWKFSDLLKGTIPKLGIEWYAKGGIFTKPTLLGNKGVGEAGPEAVLPLNRLWDELDKRYQGVTINVYGTAGQSVQELADEVMARIIAQQKRRKLAW